MTDLTDTIDAVLADPTEGAVRCALLDRLTEETPDAKAAALALVLKHPENDGPRLVYALACELSKETVLAEFIRVQCELPRTPEVLPPGQVMYSRAGGTPIGLSTHELPNPRLAELIQRQRELLAVLGRAEWFCPDGFVPVVDSLRFDDHLDGSLRWCGVRHGLEVFDVWPVRGFIERVECRASAWLTYGDVLTAAHPMRNVRMEKLPEVEHEPLNRGGPFPLMWLKGRTLRIDVPLGYPIGHPEWALRLLKAEWPGVVFDVPGYGVSDVRLEMQAALDAARLGLPISIQAAHEALGIPLPPNG